LQRSDPGRRDVGEGGAEYDSRGSRARFPLATLADIMELKAHYQTLYPQQMTHGIRICAHEAHVLFD